MQNCDNGPFLKIGTQYEFGWCLPNGDTAKDNTNIAHKCDPKFPCNVKGTGCQPPTDPKLKGKSEAVAKC
ncbi:hypothetical protein Tdes44962_MAKER01458 [Teratosphaeria destructans]|uniref:Uncharacterized protein n=1 Tax=Teratosphaeria destructans TaxID=418781 RepID=A0A9W7SZ25_9PEZI|nr:hypothetical protein Tdes44962_MAKER01458 [Teratosphaeria destructans]